MIYLVVFIGGVVVGMLNPIVIWRKINQEVERLVFPKVIELLKRWKDSEKKTTSEENN